MVSAKFRIITLFMSVFYVFTSNVVFCADDDLDRAISNFWARNPRSANATTTRNNNLVSPEMLRFVSRNLGEILFLVQEIISEENQAHLLSVRTDEILKMYNQTKARYPDLPAPKRPGEDFTDQEVGIAVAITQQAPKKSIEGYTEALSIIFSKERAEALIKKICN